MTKRDFDAQLESFLNPPPMTFEAALKAANPVSEIRKHLSFEAMTEPERLFWKADYFMGDTLNGGLIQTLENSTGDHFADVEAFANDYCSEPVRQIFVELKQMFPHGQVPANRTTRQDAIEKMMNGDDLFDPFEELTRRIYVLEKDFNKGLVEFAKKHRESFRGFK